MPGLRASAYGVGTTSPQRRIAGPGTKASRAGRAGPYASAVRPSFLTFLRATRRTRGEPIAPRAPPRLKPRASLDDAPPMPRAAPAARTTALALSPPTKLHPPMSASRSSLPPLAKRVAGRADSRKARAGWGVLPRGASSTARRGCRWLPWPNRRVALVGISPRPAAPHPYSSPLFASRAERGRRCALARISIASRPPPGHNWSGRKRHESHRRSVCPLPRDRRRSRRDPEIPGRRRLAEDAPERLDHGPGGRRRRRRAGSRLGRAAAEDADRRREGRDLQPAAHEVLQARPVGARVRRRGQSRPGLGRPGPGLRLAPERARHPH